MKNNNLKQTLVVGIMVLSAYVTIATPAIASGGGVISPVQSSADPYGLQLAGPVMEAGSDAAAKSFDQTVLPSLNAFLKADLPHAVNNMANQIFEIDPNKIVLASQTAVRAYFVTENAMFLNSVGVNVTTPGNDPSSWWNEVNSSASKLVFPDASSTEGLFPNGSGAYGTRTASEPVLPGDFVNLGTFAKGTKLDFFLIANGAQQAWAPVFSATESLNPDGFQKHVAAFTGKIFATPQLNSPFIFLSFEDYWNGGDKGIDNVIIALDVGKATVKSLLATPEPATWLTLGSFLALAVWAKRRMDRTASALA